MLSAEQVLALVPQRPPFRFLDRLLELDAEHAVGEYTFRRNESFYDGHFPNHPITPGVILLETMCQTALVALGIYLVALESLARAEQTVTLFTDAQVEFERVVRPCDTVLVHGTKVYWRREKLRAEVIMLFSDGSLVARGTVAGMGVPRHG